MLSESLVSAAGEQFSVVGPEVSKDMIDSVFPSEFFGRGDLVQFYLRYNGGSRTKFGGTFHCGNKAHRVSRGDLGEVFLEGFYSIPPNEEKMTGTRSMTKFKATILRTFGQVSEMKPFIENHMPIAFDHSGDNFWIDTQSGRIRYMLWFTWKDGPIELAASFREFVEKYWNISRDNWPIYSSPCGLGMAKERNK